MGREKLNVVSTYSGVEGLKTEGDLFDSHVMNPDEIRELFTGKRQFLAQYVYPLIPSDGFNKPVIFTGEINPKGGMTLKAEIETNRKPKTCAGWFASKILPSEYIMKDHIVFTEDEAHGFGEGSVLITTIAGEKTNGQKASLAEFLLSVTNRPGLFLKISDENDDFYGNMAIFFPAQATGWMHQSVKHGEAFVLVEQGTELTDELIEDIRTCFNRLVKKSYKKGEGLFNLTTHEPIMTQNFSASVLN